VHQVFAQVSFVEGIQPLEGVSVPVFQPPLTRQSNVNSASAFRISMAIAEFRDQELSPVNISQLIAFDLETTAQFNISSAGVALDENTRVDISSFRNKNIDTILTGSVSKLSDDRFDVRYRLWNTRTGDAGQSFLVLAPDLRLVAHRIADQVYEKLTNTKGVFATRIAYVTKQAGRYKLWVADSDGENAQAALSSPEPITFAAYSPSGKELAYVSFETKKPVIYVHEIQTGKRRIVANFGISNSAPAWTPDGNNIVFSLSRAGEKSQIFMVDAYGGNLRRVTDSDGMDTQPAFSADGKNLYFVSDRDGALQIYELAFSGGKAKRIHLPGDTNFSPNLSPDGQWLAFIACVANSCKVHVKHLLTGKITALTTTYFDTKPSFSPNSKLILYATTMNGTESLMVTTLDGSVNTRLVDTVPEVHEPRWGPYLSLN
jgi:TolB protein